MLELVSQVGETLTKKDMMIVTAESCTGGMIAQYLTAVAGSTAWFDRAYVTYSYESKEEMLGVNKDTIIKKGAVSEACVAEMAIGALQQSHAKISVACSGIAGPGGGSPDKPVGTVWLAWAMQGHEEVVTECHQFDGDRENVRLQATEKALQGVLKLIEQSA